MRTPKLVALILVLGGLLAYGLFQGLTSVNAQNEIGWTSPVLCATTRPDICEATEATWNWTPESDGVVSLTVSVVSTNTGPDSQETLDYSTSWGDSGNLVTTGTSTASFEVDVVKDEQLSVHFVHPTTTPGGSVLAKVSGEFTPTPTATSTSTPLPSATPTSTSTGTPEPTSTTTATPVVTVTSTPTATSTVMPPTVTPTTPAQRCDGGVYLDLNVFLSNNPQQPDLPELESWVYGNEFEQGRGWAASVNVNGTWSSIMELRHDNQAEWTNWIGGDSPIEFRVYTPSEASYEAVVVSTWLWNKPNNTYPDGKWLRWPLEHAELDDEYNPFRVCDDRLYAVGVQIVQK